MGVIKDMLRKVKNMLPESVWYQLMVKRARNIPVYFSDERLRAGLSKLYLEKTGRTLDFDNLETFSEKIQWLKLYFKHKDLGRAVDKYQFKKYIEEKVGKGYTVPLYGAWKNVKDINWDKLPEKFVLKSNCCSDGQCIKIIKNKKDVDFNELKEELKDWLNPYKTLLNSYCRAYWKVKPMIIAEEYVEQLDGQVYDYKFFCFGGEPKFAYVATDHFEGQISKISLYGLDWNRLDIFYGKHLQNDVEAPQSLKEMIEISKKLSKEFPFVRVDFFELDGKPVLSELTFYPGGGFNEINPPSADKEWGDMIVLPHKCVKKKL